MVQYRGSVRGVWETGAQEGTRGHWSAAEMARNVGAALRISEVPRPVLAACALLAIVAVVLGAVLMGRAGHAQLLVRQTQTEEVQGTAVEPAVPVDEIGETGALTGPGIVVHVAGAVAVPGVYELPADARTIDAVEAAGGFDPQADRDALNLAQPLVDGGQVRIPFEGEQVATSPAATAAPTGSVNINTADAAALQALPGVGEVLAAEIVRDRTVNGPFASADDLARVSGIGEKKLEALRDMVGV